MGPATSGRTQASRERLWEPAPLGGDTPPRHVCTLTQRPCWRPPLSGAGPTASAEGEDKTVNHHFIAKATPKHCSRPTRPLSPWARSFPPNWPISSGEGTASSAPSPRPCGRERLTLGRVLILPHGRVHVRMPWMWTGPRLPFPGHYTVVVEVATPEKGTGSTLRQGGGSPGSPCPEGAFGRRPSTSASSRCPPPRAGQTPPNEPTNPKTHAAACPLSFLGFGVGHDG